MSNPLFLCFSTSFFLSQSWSWLQFALNVFLLIFNRRRCYFHYCRSKAKWGQKEKKKIEHQRLHRLLIGSCIRDFISQHTTAACLFANLNDLTVLHTADWGFPARLICVSIRSRHFENRLRLLGLEGWETLDW